MIVFALHLSVVSCEYSTGSRARSTNQHFLVDAFSYCVSWEFQVRVGLHSAYHGGCSCVAAC